MTHENFLSDNYEKRHEINDMLLRWRAERRSEIAATMCLPAIVDLIPNPESPLDPHINAKKSNRARRCSKSEYAKQT